MEIRISQNQKQKHGKPHHHRNPDELEFSLIEARTSYALLNALWYSLNVPIIACKNDPSPSQCCSTNWMTSWMVLLSFLTWRVKSKVPGWLRRFIISSSLVAISSLSRVNILLARVNNFREFAHVLSMKLSRVCSCGLMFWNPRCTFYTNWVCWSSHDCTSLGNGTSCVAKTNFCAAWRIIRPCDSSRRLSFSYIFPCSIFSSIFFLHAS